jgi:hypothetical protein
MIAAHYQEHSRGTRPWYKKISYSPSRPLNGYERKAVRTIGVAQSIAAVEDHRSGSARIEREDLGVSRAAQQKCVRILETDRAGVGEPVGNIRKDSHRKRHRVHFVDFFANTPNEDAPFLELGERIRCQEQSNKQACAREPSHGHAPFGMKTFLTHLITFRWSRTLPPGT